MGGLSATYPFKQVALYYLLLLLLILCSPDPHMRAHPLASPFDVRLTLNFVLCVYECPTKFMSSLKNAVACRLVVNLTRPGGLGRGLRHRHCVYSLFVCFLSSVFSHNCPTFHIHIIIRSGNVRDVCLVHINPKHREHGNGGGFITRREERTHVFFKSLNLFSL